MKKLIFILFMLYSVTGLAAQPQHTGMNTNLQQMISQFIQNNREGELNLTIRFKKEPLPAGHSQRSNPYWEYQSRRQFSYQEDFRFRRCC